MTDLRPTPMDRAPNDPTAPLLGPGQWHCEAPVFRKGEVPAHVALIMDGNGRWANSRGLARTAGHRAVCPHGHHRRRDRRGRALPERLHLLHRELEALSRRGLLHHELRLRRTRAAH